MLKDRVQIKIKSGKGGNGHVSFGWGNKPNGGIGGDGGNVYIEGSSNMYDLRSFDPKSTISAQPGDNGGSNNATGSDGQDMIIKVPLTTHVLDLEGREIARINADGERVLLAKGGRGGLGNYFYRTKGVSKAHRGDTGKPGQSIEIELKLELYSDVLLIGFPNAGKSSLLNTITKAKSKVANYAFTTLNPKLGLLNGLTIMDLPGLIEGTAEGKGLGIKFVKHTRSARLIIHAISLESDDVVRDYLKIREELAEIDAAAAHHLPADEEASTISDKQELVLLTKSDVADPDTSEEAVKDLKKHNKNIMLFSLYDLEAIEALKDYLVKTLK